MRQDNVMDDSDVQLNLSSEINHRMTIIPTIDISKGRAVLVCEGKIIQDNGDPFQRAESLSINSDFQVVDLDRAMETGDNSEIVKKICEKYPCYIAGGIRNLEIATEFLNSNAKRVVIGTSVNQELLSKLPKNRVIVSFDIDEEYNILKRGRKELTKENIFDKIIELAEYMSFITVTFHYTEGKGKGADFEKIKVIKSFLNEKGYKIRLAVAGGINSVDQICDLVQMGVIPQLGLGLWSRTFTLGDIYSRIMDYSKMNKYFNFKDMPTIFPCVIISVDGTPLGLTYTDSNGIKETVDSGQCVFYSRERKKRWLKGETSGNVHKVNKVALNCDRTALIYIVEGESFCHLSKKSCFGINDPSKGGMLYLESVLKQSVCTKNTKDNNSISYTKKIFQNKKFQMCKILEEANEIWTASINTSNSSNKNNLIHEVSDLIYFITLYCVSNEINVQDVNNEITKRHFKLTKQVFEMKEVPKEIKIGICLNKNCNEKIYKFLSINGICINKPDEESRSLKYSGNFFYHPEIKMLPFLIKPKDVYKFIEYKLMDAVVCYQDILDNYPVNYSKIDVKSEELFDRNSTSRICVLANLDFDISIYENNPNRKLSIFTEYIYLTSLWTDKKNIIAKMVPISGCSEGFLNHGLCDVVVCVVSTGKTVKDNNLKIIDTIYESEMGIFVAKGMESILEALIHP